MFTRSDVAKLRFLHRRTILVVLALVGLALGWASFHPLQIANAFSGIAQGAEESSNQAEIGEIAVLIGLDESASLAQIAVVLRLDANASLEDVRARIHELATAAPPNLGFLFAVYTITWLTFFGYVFYMSRRQGDLENEIATLRSLLEEKERRD